MFIFNKWQRKDRYQYCPGLYAVWVTEAQIHIWLILKPTQTTILTDNLSCASTGGFLTTSTTQSAKALPWKSFNYINTSKGLNNPTKKLLLSPQNKEIEIFKKCLTATGSLTGFFSSDFRYLTIYYSQHHTHLSFMMMCLHFETTNNISDIFWKHKAYKKGICLNLR